MVAHRSSRAGHLEMLHWSLLSVHRLSVARPGHRGRMTMDSCPHVLGMLRDFRVRGEIPAARRPRGDRGREQPGGSGRHRSSLDPPRIDRPRVAIVVLWLVWREYHRDFGCLAVVASSHRAGKSGAEDIELGGTHRRPLATSSPLASICSSGSSPSTARHLRGRGGGAARAASRSDTLHL